MANYSEDFRGRIRWVGLFLFVFAGIIVSRLFYIQVLSANFYRDIAIKQYASSQLKSPLSYRGSIYFKEKNNQLVSGAVIKNGFLLSINPKILKDAGEAYEKISAVVSVDKADFLKKAAKKDDVFEIISHRLDSDKAQAIQELNIIGIDLASEEWRFYPGGTLASHILGFVGYSGNNLLGQYGIEKFFEDFLRIGDDSVFKKIFTGNAFLEIGADIFSDSPAGAENNIVLTIEPRVQGFLEDNLAKIMRDYHAEGGGGLVMEPETGKILAIAGKPDFDPNFYNKVENSGVFLNPLISSVFEVGSVFKPLTLAAGLDKGNITPETTYIDNGYVIIDDARIENYDNKARGRADMQQVLDESLNTGAVFVMRQMGKEVFKDYIINYGLNEKTGISLPDEVKGNISNLNSSREIEYATASFGQGIAVTPLAFSAAFSSLANGGFVVQPYIIENSPQSAVRGQVLKKETSDEITRMLVRVVDEALLNGKAKIAHYSVAAKTGTAQIPFEDKKGYYENEYLHCFIGYAPAFDAKFLVFLYLKKPQGVRYAAYSLTESFMNIIKFLLNYYEIPPDR